MALAYCNWMSNFSNFFISTHVSNPPILSGFVYLLALFGFRPKFGKEQLFVICLPLVYYLIDLKAASITYFNEGAFNLKFYNWALLFEIPITIFVFYSWANPLIRRIIIVSIFAFVVLHIINLSFWQTGYVVASFTIVPGQLLQAVFAYLFLLDIIDKSQVRLDNDFRIWFATSLFITVSASLPITAMVSYLNYVNTDLADKLYVLNDVMYSAWFLLLTIGLLWIKKTQSSYISL